MSNEFYPINCELCGAAIGFNFEEQINKTYCYPCGHSILLIKHKLSNKKVNFDKIIDVDNGYYSKSREYETSVIYYLNNLEKEQ